MAEPKRRDYAIVAFALRTCDAALEVVDARFLASARVEKMERRYKNKLIICASKLDLYPGKREKGVIYYSSKTGEGLEEIRAKAKEIAGNNPYRKGKDLKIAMFGLPNAGKSTLLNALCGKRSAKAAFRAGTTRGPQWVRGKDDMMFCDTQGIVDLQEGEQSLAMKAGIDVSDMENPEGAAYEILDRAFLMAKNPVNRFYGVAGESPEDALEKIAKKRGLLGKGGDPRLFEAAKIVVRDFQKGKFAIK
jgi:ribosome biogenesis GTPase A